MARTLRSRCRVLAAVLLAAVIVADASASDHRYGQGDSVPFYVNKVGPFSNPRQVTGMGLPGSFLTSQHLARMGGKTSVFGSFRSACELCARSMRLAPRFSETCRVTVTA
ncbi:unnamed protein product [Closterium sp. Naga37s-1]|nr:unnamed protein product [Closterium sp. Naga37s-1]